MTDPLVPHRHSIQQLRLQTEQFLRSRERGSTALPSAIDVARRELAGELGGALSQGLFGRKRIGVSLARAIAKNTQQAERVRRKEEARSEVGVLVERAKVLVSVAGPEIGPRLAQSLQRTLGEAEAARLPETAARKVLLVLGRLEGWHSPLPSLSTGNGDALSLRTLERALRGCIEGRLSALTPRWWEERIPPEVRARAERRKSLRNRVWPWLEGGEHSPIEYLDFPDYSKVILDAQNWTQAFADVFVDQKNLDVKLHELEPIRNDIAHSREPTRANRDRLRLYSAELVQQMSG